MGVGWSGREIVRERERRERGFWRRRRRRNIQGVFIGWVVGETTWEVNGGVGPMEGGHVRRSDTW